MGHSLHFVCQILWWAHPNSWICTLLKSHIWLWSQKWRYSFTWFNCGCYFNVYSSYRSPAMFLASSYSKFILSFSLLENTYLMSISYLSGIMLDARHTVREVNMKDTNWTFSTWHLAEERHWEAGLEGERQNHVWEEVECSQGTEEESHSSHKALSRIWCHVGNFKTQHKI